MGRARHMWLVLLLAACDGETTPPDMTMAPPDLAMSGCMLDPMRAYFVSETAFLPESEGFDLDGDGKPDNRLGRIGGNANPGFADSIKKGAAIILVAMEHLMGPPLVEGDKPLTTIILGVDADVPADPSNNAMN